MGHIFISYSRQELNFTDSLEQSLRKNGFETWFDIRNLQPGKAWQQQIDEGLAAAEAVLLVISKESMASPNVRREWHSALAQNKRIILLIFEAVKLDGEAAPLSECEWIDFRNSFKRSMKRLVELLNAAPSKSPTPPPQTGFRMPPIPRWFVRVSWGIMFTTLFFLIPYFLYISAALLRNTLTFGDWNDTNLFIILLLTSCWAFWIMIRLPILIKQRRHHFTQIVLAMIFSFPINFLGLTTLSEIINDNVLANALFTYWLSYIIASLMLILLLGSNGMYRWAGPTGAKLIAPARWFIIGQWVSLLIALLLYFLALPIVYHEGENGNGFLADGELYMLWLSIVVLPLWLLAVIYLLSLRASRRHRRLINLSANPVSLRIALDFAPEDQDGAKILQKHLCRYHQITALSEAEVVLSLISRFKTAPVNFFSEQTIIPILLEQPADGLAIHASLLERQWVDLRHGLDRRRLDRIAKLLHEPALLSTLLGHFPPRLRQVRPPTVNHVLWLLALGVFVITISTLTWWSAYFIYQSPLPAELEPIVNNQVLKEPVDGFLIVPKPSLLFGFPTADYRDNTQADFSDYKVLRWGKDSRNKALMPSYNPPLLSLSSKDYDYAAEVWCLLLAKNDRSYSRRIDTHAELFLFLDDETPSWEIAWSGRNSEPAMEVLRSNCPLKPIPDSKSTGVAVLNGVGIVALLGLTWITAYRFERRQRHIFPLVGVMVVVSLLTMQILYNPLFLLYVALLVGICIYMWWSRDLRQWLPD